MKGFYQESDHIHINLTNLAQKVLESDRIIFESSSDNHLTRTQLVNTIIQNFDNDFELDHSLIDLRDAGMYFKLRLNIVTIKLINTDRDYRANLQTIKDWSVPQFIKCLLETYARLPFIEREKLLLKNSIIEPILNAIARNKAVSVTYGYEDYKVVPICIAPAKEGTFQYLVCLLEDERVGSFRLSRLQKVKPLGKTRSIPEGILKNIEEDLSEFGPTFIKEDKVRVKVRLTQKGILSYQYSVIHRPIHVDVEHLIGKDAEDVFVFRCSEMQALYFFFRFAGEAEILEPQSLRDKFRNLYQAGLNKYQ